MKLTAAVQYSTGIDSIETVGTVPAIYGGNLGTIPGFSRVVIDTIRVEGGVNWHIREHLDAFFRYQFYDFNDPTQVELVPLAGGGTLAVPYNSGIANGFLVGFNWAH